MNRRAMSDTEAILETTARLIECQKIIRELRAERERYEAITDSVTFDNAVSAAARRYHDGACIYKQTLDKIWEAASVQAHVQEGRSRGLVSAAWLMHVIDADRFAKEGRGEWQATNF